MSSALQVAQLVLAVLMIGAVLLLVRNAGLGSSLGGSDSSFFHARRGIDRLLFNFTVALAILFFAISVLVIRVQ